MADTELPNNNYDPSKYYYKDSDELNCAYRIKHRRQIYALIPAIFILAASGMHLTWVIYYPVAIFMTKTLFQRNHLKLSWFIATLLGGVIASLLSRNINRSYLNYLSGVLIVINGVLFITLESNFMAILIARYLAGIAHGIIFLTAIIHAGEISAYKIRGALTASLSLGITLGLVISVPLGWTYYLTFNQAYGTCLIVFSIAALVATSLISYESPVFLIDNGQEDKALESLKVLRNENLESDNIRREIMELKTMVFEDKNPISASIKDSAKTVLFIAGTRVAYALSTFPINILQKMYMKESMQSSYALVVLILGRLVGEIISTSLMDSFGRRKFLLISNEGCGILLLITGIISLVNSNSVAIIGMLSLIYQICLGLGITTATISYMSESFSITQKPLSYYIILLAEMLLYISLLAIPHIFDIIVKPIVVLFVVAAVQIVGGILFFIGLPETKLTSIRQCRDKMQRL